MYVLVLRFTSRHDEQTLRERLSPRLLCTWHVQIQNVGNHRLTGVPYGLAKGTLAPGVHVAADICAWRSFDSGVKVQHQSTPAKQAKGVSYRMLLLTAETVPYEFLTTCYSWDWH